MSHFLTNLDHNTNLFKKQLWSKKLELIRFDDPQSVRYPLYPYPNRVSAFFDTLICRRV